MPIKISPALLIKLLKNSFLTRPEQPLSYHLKTLEIACSLQGVSK